MSHRFPEHGIRCRGLLFKDADDAYDFFRQRQIDDASEAAAAAHHQEELLQQQALGEGENHGSANPEG